MPASSFTSLFLSAAIGALLAAPAPAQRAVAELPTVRFETEGQTVARSAGAVRARVLLDTAAATDVVVPISTAGSLRRGTDYDLDAPVVTIPAGARSGDAILRVAGELPSDRTDTIVLALGTPSGARVSARAAHAVTLSPLRLGDPRGGLTPEQLEAFRRGSRLFEHRFTPGEGLGPFYNATACSSCHSTPVTGGASGLYRNFYLAVAKTGPSPFQAIKLPPFVSQIVPAYGSGDAIEGTEFTLEGGRPILPETYFQFPVVATQRNAIPIFGVGLFESVGNDTILGLSDPTDANGDGISGQINYAEGGLAVGRFGTKSQVNNLELFTRGPLNNQMGITSDPLDGEKGIVFLAHAFMQIGAGANEPTTDEDGVPDPEISAEDLADLIAFQRFLAPPVKKPFDAAALAGEMHFETIGCTGCHVPSLPSALGPVEAYTDLLVHDMGPDLSDEILLGEAPWAESEFRTQPLWGISRVGPYLHDGRAPTLAAAIEAHAGEAQAARDAYLALSDGERAELIAFLEHL